MARSEAPASAKAAGNGYPLRLPPPRQSSTLLYLRDLSARASTAGFRVILLEEGSDPS